jgi:hypothetical protein
MIRGSLGARLRELLPVSTLAGPPEIYGPTAINAQSGNQSLTVAFDRRGTITVFRWPRPSYYNQVQYHTTGRDRPRFGAAENEGAFLGLRVRTADDTRTCWLRDWETDQRYDTEDSDAVRTTHREPALGLTATVRDVVASDEDVLVRDVTVARSADSPVQSATLLAFANFDLAVSKTAWGPLQDLERRIAGTRARYHPDASAVVFSKSGVDGSTDTRQEVAVAVGFDGPADEWQVGVDAGTTRTGSDSPVSDRRDAYAAATCDPLPGNLLVEGVPTALLARELTFTDDEASETVRFAAAGPVSEARRTLAAARERDPDAVRAEKREWFEHVLRSAPLPNTDDETVRAVARRALLTLVTNYDPKSGAVVASIASQSPYAQDWPRDGAFVNHVLDLVGRSDWVRKRNRWYASLQEQSGLKVLGSAIVPAGTWAMNYYADGVEAGPIPWEIDQTAYAVWTLWDHYRVTGATDYLREVYPAIRRTADFLVNFRDPDTGLHRRAHEDDNLLPTRTVLGASAVWLALDSAVKAARALDEARDRARFESRRDELADAIETHLWNPEVGAYSRGLGLIDRILEHPLVPDALRALPLIPGARGDPTIYWPAGFGQFQSDRMRRHLEHVWDAVEPSFGEPEAGDRTSGLYETKALVALAKAWGDDPERMTRVRDGIQWVAHQHATPDTHVLGEAWIREDGDVVSVVSQPHTLTGLLFYIASLEAFPPMDFFPGTRDGFDSTHPSAVADRPGGESPRAE